MISNTSNIIVKLYKNNTFKTLLINIILKVTRAVNINESDIIFIINKNLDSENSDKKIFNKLRNLSKICNVSYKTNDNIERAMRKWKYIKNQLTGINITRMLDYGGGVGDSAFIIGRKILKLKKINTFVIDINDFGGIKYIPRNDITFIHYDNMNDMKSTVELITISHVLHHIDKSSYKNIISHFNKILSNDGIIVLYEHDCANINISSIIDIEHCLYDVVNSKTMTYNNFVKTFYAKYLNIDKWNKIFSKYFKPVEIIKLNNLDNSYYAFYKRN